jgi:hypothetical protein
MTELPRQAKDTLREKLLRILKRLAVLVVAGFIIGWLLNHAALAMEKRDRPAGFTDGIVQGALMPIALPNLAIGRDVPIYAINNTGRTYKLGYTMGVNACGLIFFGVFFWRLRKLKLRVGSAA